MRYKFLIFSYSLIALPALSNNSYISNDRNSILPRLHVICTSALIEENKNLRRQEYTDGIGAFEHFGYKPYIIESIAQGPTYLDKLSDRVVYTKTNNFSLRNKGVNEAMALIKFIQNCDFDDEDMVVKTTGRYILQSNNFLQLIENNNTIDAFVKKDILGQVFTGCFALRYRYLKDFLLTLNLVNMERNMINIEREFAIYLSLHDEIRVYEVTYLDLLARIGTDPTVKM